MLLKPGVIADPPDMITSSIRLNVTPVELSVCHFLTDLYGFKDRTIGGSAASDVIDFSYPGTFKEVIKGVDQIVTMYVVPHLFTFVAVDAEIFSGDRALHQVGEKTMQFRTGVTGTSYTTGAEGAGLDPEISAVLLSKNVCGNLGAAEERMSTIVNTHRFVDSVIVFMIFLDFPAIFFLN